MCFGSSSKDLAPAQDAAVAQREQADDDNYEENVKRAEDKRSDISDALSARSKKSGMRGGSGRRSLFKSGGSGFLGRFQ